MRASGQEAHKKQQQQHSHTHLEHKANSMHSALKQCPHI